MPVAEAPTDVLPTAALLIGDRRVADSSGGVHDHIYPGTGKPTAQVPLAGAAEVDAAVAAARAAQPAWAAMPADQRRRLMLRMAELIRTHGPELSTLSIVENGMPALIAGFSPDWCADLFEYNAGWTDKIGGEIVPTWPVQAIDYTLEEPYGVVAVIIPWNGPVISLGQTCSPALAAGNCVVMKPPELAPWTALRLGEIALEAGFPPGVFNVIPGGPEGGAALVAHKGVDKVHFTGSGATAKHILAGALQTLKPVGLELGGKSANLIFDDTDLMAAVGQAIGAVVNLSGQGCINGTRVFAQAAVYDQVVELATQFLSAVKLGDPFEPDTLMGPVVSAAACDRIVGMIEKAKQSSARLALGGNRAGGDLADGYFIEPTVFADVQNQDYIAQNEVFGPVLSILRFESEDDAIRMANDTDFGLAGYVWTKDLQRAHRVASALTAGNIWVNGFLGIPAGAPFGGTKQSGYGRLGGRDGIREFTRPKNVWVNLT
jgi:acyl-CoA reductase-like NAD-dependent aldehyde dehydrogenase